MTPMFMSIDSVMHNYDVRLRMESVPPVTPFFVAGCCTTCQYEHPSSQCKKCWWSMLEAPHYLAEVANLGLPGKKKLLYTNTVHTSDFTVKVTKKVWIHYMANNTMQFTGSVKVQTVSCKTVEANLSSPMGYVGLMSDMSVIGEILMGVVVGG